MAGLCGRLRHREHPSSYRASGTRLRRRSGCIHRRRRPAAGPARQKLDEAVTRSGSLRSCDAMRRMLQVGVGPLQLRAWVRAPAGRLAREPRWQRQGHDAAGGEECLQEEQRLVPIGAVGTVLARIVRDRIAARTRVAWRSPGPKRNATRPEGNAEEPERIGAPSAAGCREHQEAHQNERREKRQGLESLRLAEANARLEEPEMKNGATADRRSCCEPPGEPDRSEAVPGGESPSARLVTPMVALRRC